MTTKPDKCREQFEKWYGNHYDFSKSDNGNYKSITIHSFYECWQAAWQASKSVKVTDAQRQVALKKFSALFFKTQSEMDTPEYRVYGHGLSAKDYELIESVLTSPPTAQTVTDEVRYRLEDTIEEFLKEVEENHIYIHNETRYKERHADIDSVVDRAKELAEIVLTFFSTIRAATTPQQTAEKNKEALDALERIHTSSLGRAFYNGVTDDFRIVRQALTTPSVPQEDE